MCGYDKPLWLAVLFLLRLSFGYIVVVVAVIICVVLIKYFTFLFVAFWWVFIYLFGCLVDLTKRTRLNHSSSIHSMIRYCGRSVGLSVRRRFLLDHIVEVVTNSHSAMSCLVIYAHTCRNLRYVYLIW